MRGDIDNNVARQWRGCSPGPQNWCGVPPAFALDIATGSDCFAKHIARHRDQKNGGWSTRSRWGGDTSAMTTMMISDNDNTQHMQQSHNME
jgi:hypothetical protein